MNGTMAENNAKKQTKSGFTYRKFDSQGIKEGAFAPPSVLPLTTIISQLLPSIVTAVYFSFSNIKNGYKSRFVCTEGRRLQ